MIGRIEPSAVRLDCRDTLLVRQLVDVPLPERLHDDEITAGTRPCGMEGSRSERQQFAPRLESRQLDVQISRGQVQRGSRSDPYLVETHEQPADIHDSLP